MRTHLIHRPARDIIPPLGGARVSFYWSRCCTVFMLLLWAVLGSSGTIGRPCRQANGRSKRTCELTSSLVPHGTSFHRSVELECPSIGVDAARFLCCCCGLFSGPAELGAVNPYAVHDHSQPTCQGHDRLFHSAAPGDLHRPGFEPGPFLRSQHAL